MRRILLFLIVCIQLFSYAGAQNSMTVMFWNTENLFDVYDDPGKNDEDFTPDGDYRWTIRRYRSKLDAVARVVAAADEESAPAIVGLCEVENDSVLKDITERSPLRSIGYRYVMTDSPDQRGIDVALMYRRSYFRLIESKSLKVNLRPYGGSATRDILHVMGLIESGDTLDVFVCHWPSRRGGTDESEPMRLVAAGVVRNAVDSIFTVRRKPYVIIMGDLNEGCDDPAVRDGLKAEQRSKGAQLPDRELVTLMDGQPHGSYKYQGEWECYDQFVVSASLLNGLGCTEVIDASVFTPDFMLADDDNYGGQKPLRTYNGRRYQNGYSDHLPILLRLSY